jgi:hypothetical protein
MLLLYENLQNISLPTFFVNRGLNILFANKLMNGSFKWHIKAMGCPFSELVSLK